MNYNILRSKQKKINLKKKKKTAIKLSAATAMSSIKS